MQCYIGLKCSTRVANTMSTFTSPSCSHTATADICSCSFFTSMLLPCRHILYARKLAGLPSFCEDLCASRWTREFYQRSHRVFVAAVDVGQRSSLTVRCRNRKQHGGCQRCYVQKKKTRSSFVCSKWCSTAHTGRHIIR